MKLSQRAQLQINYILKAAISYWIITVLNKTKIENIMRNSFISQIIEKF